MTIAATLGDDALTLVAFDGRHFGLVSARAFAPGYPLPLTLALDAPTSVELKSIGSKRRPDGSFDVRARAMTLRKEVRERLLAHFASAP